MRFCRYKRACAEFIEPVARGFSFLLSFAMRWVTALLIDTPYRLIIGGGVVWRQLLRDLTRGARPLCGPVDPFGAESDHPLCVFEAGYRGAAWALNGG